MSEASRRRLSFVVEEIELVNARAEEPIDSHNCIIVVPLEAKQKEPFQTWTGGRLFANEQTNGNPICLSRYRCSCF